MESLQNKEQLKTINLKEVRELMEELNFRYADPFDGILKYDKQGKNVTFWKEGDFPLTKEKIQTTIDTIHDNFLLLEQTKALLEKSSENPSLIALYLTSLNSKQERLKMLEHTIWLEAEKS